MKKPLLGLEVMADKTPHLTILILQLRVSFTNKLTTIIHQLIKPLANIYHPFCKADDGWANIGAFPKIHRHIEMVDEGFCI